MRKASEDQPLGRAISDMVRDTDAAVEASLSGRTGSGAYTAEGKETLDDPSSSLRSLTTKLEEAERELAAVRRRAAPVAGPDQGARREAAKKLLCDICACSAEAEPASLDLPHVVADCLEPLETLIAERDICLFLSQQAHKYLGRDGHDILDAIAERCAAESRALLAEAKLGEAETENTRLKALVELAGEVVEPFAEFFGDLFDADAPDGMVFWSRAGTGATIQAGHSRAASALLHQIRESGK